MHVRGLRELLHPALAVSLAEAGAQPSWVDLLVAGPGEKSPRIGSHLLKHLGTLQVLSMSGFGGVLEPLNSAFSSSSENTLRRLCASSIFFIFISI